MTRVYIRTTLHCFCSTWAKPDQLHSFINRLRTMPYEQRPTCWLQAPVVISQGSLILLHFVDWKSNV